MEAPSRMTDRYQRARTVGLSLPTDTNPYISPLAQPVPFVNAIQLIDWFGKLRPPSQKDVDPSWDALTKQEQEREKEQVDYLEFAPDDHDAFLNLYPDVSLAPIKGTRYYSRCAAALREHWTTITDPEQFWTNERMKLPGSLNADLKEIQKELRYANPSTIAKAIAFYVSPENQRISQTIANLVDEIASIEGAHGHASAQSIQQRVQESLTRAPQGAAFNVYRHMVNPTQRPATQAEIQQQHTQREVPLAQNAAQSPVRAKVSATAHRHTPSSRANVPRGTSRGGTSRGGTSRGGTSRGGKVPRATSAGVTGGPVVSSGHAAAPLAPTRQPEEYGAGPSTQPYINPEDAEEAQRMITEAQAVDRNLEDTFLPPAVIQRDQPGAYWQKYAADTAERSAAEAKDEWDQAQNNIGGDVFPDEHSRLVLDEALNLTEGILQRYWTPTPTDPDVQKRWQQALTHVLMHGNRLAKALGRALLKFPDDPAMVLLTAYEDMLVGEAGAKLRRAARPVLDLLNSYGQIRGSLVAAIDDTIQNSFNVNKFFILQHTAPNEHDQIVQILNTWQNVLAQQTIAAMDRAIDLTKQTMLPHA